MKSSVSLLPQVSPERLRDELFRILQGSKPSACLKALDILSALPHILPELASLKQVQQPPPHVQDVWLHTLSVLSHLDTILSALSADYIPESAQDFFHGSLVTKLGRYRAQIAQHLDSQSTSHRSRRSLLFFSALYHDIAKPATATLGEDEKIRFWGHDQLGSQIASQRARALVLSNDEIASLDLIVRNHMRIHFHTRRLMDEGKLPSRKAIYRFFRDVDSTGIDICLLSLADLWATYESTLPQQTWLACLDVVRLLLESWWEKKEEYISPHPFLNGTTMMQSLQIQPGPLLGRIIEAVREEQAAGNIHSEADALAAARNFLSRFQQGQVKEFLHVSDSRLAYFQRPGEGLPLILIHGYPLDHTIWQNILPGITSQAHLILPDLRGHGSSLLSSGQFTVETLADDLFALLRSLKLKSAILIGHSLGGYASLAFAKKYPQHLLGLGLVCSRATADSPSQREARLKMIADIRTSGIQPVVDAMAPRLVADPNLISSLKPLIAKMSPFGAISALQAMLSREDTTTSLANLSCPVSILAGSSDTLIPPDVSRQMHTLNASFTYLELENIAHMPMLESPSRTVDWVNDLYTRVINAKSV